MAFYTKVDYSRQLFQSAGTAFNASGSTWFGQNVTVGGYSSVHNYLTVGNYLTSSGYSYNYIAPWANQHIYTGCTDCRPCSTGFTFMVGPYSATSGSCLVTITPFSAVTGTTAVLSIGKPPFNPVSGGTTLPSISASTLQIANKGLIAYGTNGSSAIDLQLDEEGNVVRGNSSSLRYKSHIHNAEENRYIKLLTLSPKFFTYNETGRKGFGLIAEDLDKLGYSELVIYNRKGQPENIEYKLLSVALIDILKTINKSSASIDLYNAPITPILNEEGAPQLNYSQEKSEIITKTINDDYISDGEYLIVSSSNCNVTLNSDKNSRIKLKAINGVMTIIPDNGLIDDRWKTIELTQDSCVECVFVKELSYWVVVSSDGIKDS
tara:strand:+ start:1120 stop:2253 length:1134 start_codon:yes stop_codon:yes gene_type:complete